MLKDDNNATMFAGPSYVNLKNVGSGNGNKKMLAALPMVSHQY